MYKKREIKLKDVRLKISIVITLTILVIASNFIIIGTYNNANKYHVKNNNTIENSPILFEKDKIKQSYENMKGYFTKNQGQLDNDEIFFIYSTYDKTFGFSESSVILKLSNQLEGNKTKSSIIKITFENSNKVIPRGINKLNHNSNFFVGNDSSKWKRNIPNYEIIVYENLYNGIDLIYYFNEKGLKYDWIVKPYANPDVIVEKLEGIDSMKIDTENALLITTKAGKLKEEKPYSYQKIDDKVIEINTDFRKIGKNRITYEIEKYEKSEYLIIDPLIYSTYVGEEAWDYGYDIVVDSENNAYITGDTRSNNFPTTPGSYSNSYGNYSDVFVFKLNSDGTDLLYSTFVGGSPVGQNVGGSDFSRSITIDKENNVYVTGYTRSYNFPTTPDCYDDSHSPEDPFLPTFNDVFVFKLNSDGSDLLYSTYVQGNNSDCAFDIELDAENNAYITGYTYADDFPVTQGCYDDSHNNESDVFVFKLNHNGTSLLYSTFIGGESWDEGNGICIDSENNAYITGSTYSTNFPTSSGSFDEKHNGYFDVFVLKINSDATSLLYSTLIGGNKPDTGRSIVLDSENNAYITGRTNSSNFPTTILCYDDEINGKSDVFVTILNNNGSKLLYSTYIGGDYHDEGYGLAIDSNKNIYVSGYTLSSNFPTTPNTCYDYLANGGHDIFVFKLDANGTKLLYSTLVGGELDDIGNSLALDSKNHVYITGYTPSLEFPTTPHAFNGSNSGRRDVIAFKVFPNIRPVAIIESISPNKGNESEIVNFYGNTIDDGIIQEYYWRSSLDGFLSKEKSFSVSNLSNGTHTIYFMVKDNFDIWSVEVHESVRINGNPRAIIKEIKPISANEGEKVIFNGKGKDDVKINSYSWRSNLDGFLSDKISFSKSTLSNGTHIIYFKTQDNNDVWSEEVSMTLVINDFPIAKINDINPNPANEGEGVWFDGEGVDKGAIEEYNWQSNIDGFLSNNKTFNISNLSNGTHKIYLKVKDNHNTWSDQVFTNMTINGLSRAKIEEINPLDSFEGEKVRFIGSGKDDGLIEGYEWSSNIGGIISIEESFSISNLSVGTHTIYFKVKDNNGFWSNPVSSEIKILQNIEDQKLVASLFISKTKISINETITVDGLNSTGNNVKYFFEFGDGRNSSWADIPKFNITYSKPGKYIIKLKIRDSSGNESSYDEIEIIVSESNVKQETDDNLWIWLVLILAIILIVIFNLAKKSTSNKKQSLPLKENDNLKLRKVKKSQSVNENQMASNNKLKEDEDFLK